MGRLEGKVIVLSAAAQGIGRAAAIVMKTPSPQKSSLIYRLYWVFSLVCIYVFFFFYHIHYFFIVHIGAFSNLGVPLGLKCRAHCSNLRSSLRCGAETAFLTLQRMHSTAVCSK